MAPETAPSNASLTRLALASVALFAGLSPVAGSIADPGDMASLLGALPVDAAPASLTWRPVTDSTNWSFNAIQTQFGPGGAFEGYRHATTAEVWSYVLGSGYDPLATAQANAQVVQQLHSFFGVTHASSLGQFNAWTLGFTAEGGRVDIRYTIPNFFDPSSNQGFVYDTVYDQHDAASSMLGHYLVAVPEPATIAALLGAVALAGVVLARRRK